MAITEDEGEPKISELERRMFNSSFMSKCSAVVKKITNEHEKNILSLRGGHEKAPEKLKLSFFNRPTSSEIKVSNCDKNKYEELGEGKEESYKKKIAMLEDQIKNKTSPTPYAKKHTENLQPSLKVSIKKTTII